MAAFSSAEIRKSLSFQILLLLKSTSVGQRISLITLRSFISFYIVDKTHQENKQCISLGVTLT